MNQRTIAKNKAVSGLFVATVATCHFAAAALGPAPTANADCVSFSGINLGSGCTSSFGGLAIALGVDATARATGFLSTATAIGTGASATAVGSLDMATALGKYTYVYAGNPTGFANRGVALGENSTTIAGGQPGGIGNTATNLGTYVNAQAEGVLSSATDISSGGITTTVRAVGFANNAFNVGGGGNSVVAEPGPLAVAGSFFQTGAKVTKVGPGFNINGIAVGGAAAPTAAVDTAAVDTATAAVDATALHTKLNTTGGLEPAHHAITTAKSAVRTALRTKLTKLKTAAHDAVTSAKSAAAGSEKAKAAAE
jgi:hypothetical protein